MNAFLYSETDLRVLTKFLKESLSTLCDELTTLSLYVIDRGNRNIVHHIDTVINDHLIASA